MRFFRRRASEGQDGAATEPNGGRGVAVAEAPVTGSPEELRAEIERLTAENRAQPSTDTERRLLALRNALGLRRMAAAGTASEPVHPEPDAAILPAANGNGLPEIAAADLAPGLLRAGILRDGCLLVRGLIPREDAIHFAEQIDRTFAERELHDTGKPHDGGYFTPFAPDPVQGGECNREWVKDGGGVLAVDAPLLAYEMLEYFADAGLPALVEAYLGEPPLITAQKTTLRKADPSVSGAWHQDGKFMGPVRALNLWLSLSRCGDESPGLDLVPRRFNEYVTTGTDEAAWFFNMVSQNQAELAASETSIIRPIFEPGDALLFDELFLHKTGSDPTMPNPRFAIENWFFGGSAFPADYAPIAV